MPMYFFDITGTSPYSDITGVELLDDTAAWSTAVKSTGELLSDLDGALPDRAEIIITVTDGNGRTVVTLHFTGTKGADGSAA